MDENNITLEEKIWAQNNFSGDFEIEEFLEDYLPEVKKHIGFKDERDDPRFVVKFHDICFYTNTQDTSDEKADMAESEFDSLFGTFCTDMYENTKQFMAEEGISDSELFSIHDAGHYKAFEKIIPEYGGADQDALSSIGNYMKKNMKEFLKECDKKTPEQLVEERYKRFRKF